jgi:DNA-binding TFAR19-related protein (PDSD5 family)
MCWLGTPADKQYASENHLLAPITDTAFIEMLEDVSEAQKRELQLGR